jgi:hypothetical protein
VQIADTFQSKNIELDKELEKLKIMDPELASEIVEYRKNYAGGIRSSGPPPPAKDP